MNMELIVSDRRRRNRRRRAMLLLLLQFGNITREAHHEGYMRDLRSLVWIPGDDGAHIQAAHNIVRVMVGQCGWHEHNPAHAHQEVSERARSA